MIQVIKYIMIKILVRTYNNEHLSAGNARRRYELWK